MFALKLALIGLLVLHGALHLLGFAKGFNLAALPQLQLPISRHLAVWWLVAASALVAAATALTGGSRYWGAIGVVASVLSQVLIFGQFKDAKYGTVANVLIFVPALLGALDLRPSSLRSSFLSASAELIHSTEGQAATPVGASELAHLPTPVQRYLTRVGVVGKPRVQTLHVTGSLKMRRSPNEAWMDSTMEQYSAFADLQRLFFMVARKGPITFDVFHRFADGQAQMQAKVLGVFPVMDARGEELTQSETVTVLNDMCLLAPVTLLEPRLSWESIDDFRARVWLTHAGHRVSAELYFNANGELVNFVSNDRFQSDGVTSKRIPWSTPVTGYRDFQGYHLASTADAQWEETTGLWTYAQFSIEHISYDASK